MDVHAIEDCITDGGNDLGVDAIYITRSGERPEVHVIQSKCHTSTRKASNPFKISDARKFRDFLQAVKNRETDLSKVSNIVLAEKIQEIRKLQATDFPLFRCWLVSNGERCRLSDLDPLGTELSKFDAELSEFHLAEFYDFCVSGKSKRTDHSFFTCGQDVIEFGVSGARGVVGLISAKELYLLISDITEAERIDFGLFDSNIRGFLGSDNQINRQIYKSLSIKDNSRFWCLNNGITLTGSRFRVLRSTPTPKIGVKELRVVNGAQTCGALFQAINDYDHDYERFRDVAISFRLFETEEPQFVEDIAISSNSQNRVNARDLKTNHPYQFALEAELLKVGIRYIRKRGITDYEGAAKDAQAIRAIDALKVGQVILSFMQGIPERAKRDSDAIFEDLYEKIFGSVDYEKLNLGICLYWLILERRDIVEDDIRLKGRHKVSNDFITYGVFHVLYACRVLIDRDHTAADDKERLVSDAIALVRAVVNEAGNPAPYIFFRKPGTADSITNFGIQTNLFTYSNIAI